MEHRHSTEKEPHGQWGEPKANPPGTHHPQHHESHGQPDDALHPRGDSQRTRPARHQGPGAGAVLVIQANQRPQGHHGEGMGEHHVVGRARPEGMVPPQGQDRCCKERHASPVKPACPSPRGADRHKGGEQAESDQSGGMPQHQAQAPGDPLVGRVEQRPSPGQGLGPKKDVQVLGLVSIKDMAIQRHPECAHHQGDGQHPQERPIHPHPAPHRPGSPRQHSQGEKRRPRGLPGGERFHRAHSPPSTRQSRSTPSPTSSPTHSHSDRKPARARLTIPG